MLNVKLFIELTRLNKPIGYMLLFWPCIWGLTIAYEFTSELETYFFYILLFFLGAVLMRSAGCIVNDITDKNFDKLVERTKNRPIASGKVSVKLASFYSFILCGIAFLVLINFNFFTIWMALLSMPLAFSYPLMKRFTYWPQLFLGITFNYGLVLAWISVTNEISILPIIFYIGAIFWTLGYDTIYGYQDIRDGEIIGLKSTSIKFKGKAKKFLIMSYSLLIILFSIGGYFMKFDPKYYFILFIPFMHLFFYQIKNLNLKNPTSCLRIFKSNNIFGFIIFLNILVAKNL